MPRKNHNRRDVKLRGGKIVTFLSKGTVNKPAQHKEVKPKQTPVKTRTKTRDNLLVKQPAAKSPVKRPVKSIKTLGGRGVGKAGARHKSPAKQTVKSAKTPGGRGLGKAGAKRLGQLLKRAIQDKKNDTGNKNAPLPMTPVRLFKAKAAPKSIDTKTGSGSPRLTKLILRMVSQCKRKGGISIVELKQALAAGGYNVTKNNTQKRTDEKTARTRVVRHAAVQKAKQTKGEARPAGRKDNLKTKGKAVKPGAGKPAGKSTDPAGRSPKTAGRATEPVGKDREVAGGPKRGGRGGEPPRPAPKSPKRSQEQGIKFPKAAGQRLKPTGKTGKEANRKIPKTIVTSKAKTRVQQPRAAKRQVS